MVESNQQNQDVPKAKISRRDLLKSIPAVAAIAGVSGLTYYILGGGREVNTETDVEASSVTPVAVEPEPKRAPVAEVESIDVFVGTPISNPNAGS